MPSSIVTISKRQSNAIAKINHRAASLDSATGDIAKRWAQEAIKIGQMLIAERDRHQEEQKKKADKSQKVRWESLFSGQKSELSEPEKFRFSMTYRQAHKYQSIANRPNIARQNALETGCVNINDTAKKCSNATDDDEAVAMLALSPPKDNHRAIGTGENEWYTPAKYIELVRELFGSITLDPASSDSANKVVMAESYFTSDDDGLKKDWCGSVWLNPPYSQPHIADFVDKLTSELACGNVDEAVMLTHNYTDTKWFQLAAKHCSAICFTRGRIAFESPTGEKAAPTQGQAFFYFGENTTEFTRLFSEIGFVVVPV